MGKEGQGSALDPLGPEAPDPLNKRCAAFLASWRSHEMKFLASLFRQRFLIVGVWGPRPQRGPGAEPLAFTTR